MLSFSLEDSSLDLESHISHQNSSYILQYPCDNVLDQCSPFITTFRPFTYFIEVWGAQGGYNGGKGGYSKGIISFKKNTKAYIYIGAKGPEISNGFGITPESYNGGGSGSAGKSTDKRATGSGGGGTDIRIIGKTEYYRIIVAGGGGGSAYTNIATSSVAGFGGGINGGDGDGSPAAKGGTQFNASEVESNIYRGSFGKGGGADPSSTLTFAGGGGGWYGGSSSKISSGRGAAGGSGYVLHSSSYKPPGYKITNKDYFFTYWELYSGDMTFPQCSGPFQNTELYETGHAGSGCVRITILDTERCTIIYKANKCISTISYISVFIIQFNKI